MVIFAKPLLFFSCAVARVTARVTAINPACAKEARLKLKAAVKGSSLLLLTMPSITDDEELARALQEEYQRDFEASRTRQRPPPTTAPSEVIRPVQSTSVPPLQTETDEELARRLEQEMKDEEMARRLSVEENSPQTSSRPRPSASTLMQSRNRESTYYASVPVAHENIAPRSPPENQTPRPSRSSRHSSTSHNESRNSHSSRDRRSTSSGRRSSENGRHTTSTGRRPSDWTRSTPSGRPSSNRRLSNATHERMSSSRRAVDVTGSTGNQSTSIRQSSRRQHRSSHSSGQGYSRGRGSAVSPAVEPDYALPVTSTDPPIVQASVVEPMTTVPEMSPYAAPSSNSSQGIVGVYTGPAPDIDVDVELALRLAQEERDAAIAQQLERSEQEYASRNATRVATSSGPRRQRPWTCRRAACILIPVVLIAGAAVVIMLLVAGRGDLSNIPNVFDNDPFSGGNPEDASRWKTRGNGLQLEVVNALEEQWWDKFNLAMDEWDAGTPDALMLSRSSAEYDFDCSPIQGKMKVCNGDYGDTRWKGINQVLLSGGWIISSTAKLNDYYLSGASDAQRQYTACHEIGTCIKSKGQKIDALFLFESSLLLVSVRVRLLTNSFTSSLSLYYRTRLWIASHGRRLLQQRSR